MHDITLTTARLTLDRPRETDTDAVSSHCRDEELQRFVPVPVPYEREHAEGFVLGLVPAWDRDGVEHVFAIRRTADGPDAPLLGIVSWQRARGYLGYWLGAEHRGDGIMTEAVQGLLPWIFAHEEASTLAWECVQGNLASAAVARAAGFRFVGDGEIDHRGGPAPAWRAHLRRDEFGTIDPASWAPVLG